MKSLKSLVLLLLVSLSTVAACGKKSDISSDSQTLLGTRFLLDRENYPRAGEKKTFACIFSVNKEYIQRQKKMYETPPPATTVSITENAACPSENLYATCYLPLPFEATYYYYHFESGETKEAIKKFCEEERGIFKSIE